MDLRQGVAGYITGVSVEKMSDFFFLLVKNWHTVNECFMQNGSSSNVTNATIYWQGIHF